MTLAPAAIFRARIGTHSRQSTSKRWEIWNIVGPYIPYDLPQTKGVTCAKFGSDRSRNVDLYKFHTNKQTNKQTNKHSSLYIRLYDVYLIFCVMLYYITTYIWHLTLYYHLHLKLYYATTYIWNFVIILPLLCDTLYYTATYIWQFTLYYHIHFKLYDYTATLFYITTYIGHFTLFCHIHLTLYYAYLLTYLLHGAESFLRS